MNNVLTAIGVAILLVFAASDLGAFRGTNGDDASFSSLESEVSGLSWKVDSLESEVAGPWGIKSKLSEIESKLSNLESAVTGPWGIEYKLDSVESSVSGMESSVDGISSEIGAIRRQLTRW